MLMGSVAEIKPPEKETVFIEDLPDTETFSGLYNNKNVIDLCDPKFTNLFH